MVMWVVDFSREGYKIRWVFGQKSKYSKEMIVSTDEKTGLLKRSQKCIQKNLLVKSSKNKIIFSLAFYLTLRLMKLPEKF